MNIAIVDTCYECSSKIKIIKHIKKLLINGRKYYSEILIKPTYCTVNLLDTIIAKIVS